MYRERPHRPAVEYFQQLAWALFLFNSILFLAGLLVARFLDSRLAFGLFVGTGAMTTAALLVVVGLNAVVLWLHDRWERRHPRG